ncbi:MAG TPA: hypothetical protein VIL94_00595 [Acidothermaceae bacterium]
MSIRTDAHSRIIAATATLLLTASLAAGCTSPTHRATGSTASASSPAPVSVAASGGPSAAASPASATSAAAASSAVTSSGPAENRVVTPDVRAQLLAGFLRKHGFAADQISGTRPGSVYYAYVASTNTYWAAATFVASSTATEQTGVNMQDGGAEATFTRVGTGAWDVHIHDGLWPCPGDLPASVLAVWHLTIVEGCAVAPEGSPGAYRGPPTIALPDGQYFGYVLSETFDGDHGSMGFDPETWDADPTPADNVYAFSTVPFDTSAVTEYSVGNDAASSHVVTGHMDAAFFQLMRDATSALTSTPGLGYVVTVHAGAATSIQQISALTPAPPDRKFTEPKP